MHDTQLKSLHLSYVHLSYVNQPRDKQSLQARPLQRIKQTGASLVEFVVVLPTLLFAILGIMQSGMVFHAKSNLNYATFEAARAGTVQHADINNIRAAFTRAMIGYYGGGRTAAEIATATTHAAADITPTSLQVELLSPTKQSFDDYASPRLAAKYNTKSRVIPNNNLSAITCPTDKPSCNNNPQSNASGQTLSDANLMRIKITYGIPAAKQMPLVGPFYVKVLQGLTDLGIVAETDPFKLALLQQGRIPMVTHTTMRMQSEAIENGNVSSPGPGNNGTPGVTTPVNPAPVGGSGAPGPGEGEEEIEPCDPTVDKACAPTPGSCDEGVVTEDLPSDVLFDFGLATLIAAGKTELDKLVQILNAEKTNSYRVDEIIVTGHADKIGNDADNLTLSQARADTVKDYIQQHIDDDVDVEIKAEGVGELQPKILDGSCTDVDSPSNQVSCAADRRVTIKRVYATF